MSKELIKNTGTYFIISFSAQAVIFLLWLILAWWLVPSQIGTYALVMFIIDFFSTISIFGLGATITRFYYTKEKNVPSILSNALVILSGSTILSLLLFGFTAELLPFFISGLPDILEKNLFLFSAIIFANSIANFALVHYTALKKALSFAKLHLSQIVLFFLISLTLVRLGFGILGVFYALLLSSLLIVILFVVEERKLISFQPVSFLIIKNLTYYGLPLMLYGLFGVVTLYFSRILLDRYTDLSILGVYSFFLTLTLQVNGLWTSFNQAWIPEIFSKFLENKKKTMEYITFMVFFSSFGYLIMFVLLFVLGEFFLFKLIFKEIYFLNRHLLYVLLLGPLLTGIYTAAYPLYYYKNKTTRVLFVSILLSGLNILLTFSMVKFFSQIGAAISYFIISIFTALAYLFAFKKTMQIPTKIINWTLIISLLMVINVVLFLKTSSAILFLFFLISGIILAYKTGDLAGKKYLFFDILRRIREKLSFKTIK